MFDVAALDLRCGACDEQVEVITDTRGLLVVVTIADGESGCDATGTFHDAVLVDA